MKPAVEIVNLSYLHKAKTSLVIPSATVIHPFIWVRVYSRGHQRKRNPNAGRWTSWTDEEEREGVRGMKVFIRGRLSKRDGANLVVGIRRVGNQLSLAVPAFLTYILKACGLPRVWDARGGSAIVRGSCKKPIAPSFMIFDPRSNAGPSVWARGRGNDTRHVARYAYSDEIRLLHQLFAGCATVPATSVKLTGSRANSWQWWSDLWDLAVIACS